MAIAPDGVEGAAAGTDPYHWDADEPPVIPGTDPLPDELCKTPHLERSFRYGMVGAAALLLAVQTLQPALIQGLSVAAAFAGMILGYLNTVLWGGLVVELARLRSEAARAEQEGYSASPSSLRLLLLFFLKSLIIIAVITFTFFAASAEIFSAVAGFTLFVFFGTFVLAFNSKKLMKERSAGSP